MQGSPNAQRIGKSVFSPPQNLDSQQISTNSYNTDLQTSDIGSRTQEQNFVPNQDMKFEFTASNQSSNYSLPEMNPNQANSQSYFGPNTTQSDKSNSFSISSGKFTFSPPPTGNMSSFTPNTQKSSFAAPQNKSQQSENDEITQNDDANKQNPQDIENEQDLEQKFQQYIQSQQNIDFITDNNDNSQPKDNKYSTFKQSNDFVVEPPNMNNFTTSFENPDANAYENEQEQFVYELNDDFSSSGQKDHISNSPSADQLSDSYLQHDNDNLQQNSEINSDDLSDPDHEDLPTSLFDVDISQHTTTANNNSTKPVSNDEERETKVIAGITIEKGNKDDVQQHELDIYEDINEDVQEIPEDMLEDMLDAYNAIEGNQESDKIEVEAKPLEVAKPTTQSLSLGKRSSSFKIEMNIPNIDEDDFDPLSDMLECKPELAPELQTMLSEASDCFNESSDIFGDIPEEALRDMLDIDEDVIVDVPRKTKPTKTKVTKPKAPKRNIQLDSPKVQELNLPMTKTITLQRNPANIRVWKEGNVTIERRMDLRLIVSDFTQSSQQKEQQQQQEKQFNTRPTDGPGQTIVGQTKSFTFDPTEIAEEAAQQPTPKISSFDFAPAGQAAYQAPSSLSTFATKQSIFNTTQPHNPTPPPAQFAPVSPQPQFVSPQPAPPAQQQQQQQQQMQQSLSNVDATQVLKDSNTQQTAPIDLLMKEELQRLRKQVSEQEQKNTLNIPFSTGKKGPMQVLSRNEIVAVGKIEGFFEPETFDTPEHIDNIAESAASQTFTLNTPASPPPPPVITAQNDVSPTKRHFRASPIKERKSKNKAEFILTQKGPKARKNSLEIVVLIALGAVGAIILGIASFYFMPSAL